MSAAPVCGLIPELYNREDRWVEAARRQAAALRCSLLCLRIGCDGCWSSALSSSMMGCGLEHEPSKPFFALAAWDASSQPQKESRAQSIPPPCSPYRPFIPFSSSLSTYSNFQPFTNFFHSSMALHLSCICPSFYLAVRSFIYPFFPFIHTFSFF